MHEQLRLVITGRVQGVGYRAWTASTAQTLGLHGWVRNRSDGAVEAIFSGDANRIGNMVDACKQGPSGAKVEKIEIFHYKETVTPVAFHIKPTI